MSANAIFIFVMMRVRAVIIVEMAEAAKKLGYEYIAITDHSKSDIIARGMDEKKLQLYLKAIEEARKKAEEALKQKHLLSEEEYATAAANLQKALVQLKVKRRHRRL